MLLIRTKRDTPELHDRRTRVCRSSFLRRGADCSGCATAGVQMVNQTADRSMTLDMKRHVASFGALHLL